jgi:hypothetical protein
MSMVGGWVASPDTYRFDSCRALWKRSEKREVRSEKKDKSQADKNVCPTKSGKNACPTRMKRCEH